MAKMVAEGKKAPEFSLATDGGGTVSLKDFAGKTLVLYFYPKDDTTGCTAEALDFSGAAPAFKRLGAAIVGVSKDSVASHDKFKIKHNLCFSLASDPGGDVVKAYGCWVEKSMYGRKYMGIERTTFVIDGNSQIAKIWRKVKVTGHVEAVRNVVKSR